MKFIILLAIVGLVAGLAIAILLSATLAVLTWLFKDELAGAYRKHLDVLVTQLDAEKPTLFRLGRRFFRRVIKRTQWLAAEQRRRRKAIASFLLLSLVLNSIVPWIAFATVTAYLSYETHVKSMSQDDFSSPYQLAMPELADSKTQGRLTAWWKNMNLQWKDKLSQVHWRTPCLATIIIAILGTIFDVFSLVITWKIVRGARGSRDIYALLGHLILDAAVAIVAFTWAIGMMWLSQEMLADFLKIVAAERHLGPSFIETLSYKPVWWFVVIATGISSALPTITYLMLGTLLVSLRLSPSWVRKILSRVVYNVTTDEMPVIKQLRKVIIVVGGSMGTIAGWIIAWWQLY